MDARRRQLGERVRTEREAQGYRSQPALADAAGVGARSIAKIELGDESAGRKVLAAVARTLGYPKDAFADFLRTGDYSLIAAPSTRDAPPVEQGAQVVERILAMTHGELAAEAAEYDAIDPGSGDEWLAWALDFRKRARQKATSPTREPAHGDARS